jgi:hypothetical protein
MSLKATAVQCDACHGTGWAQGSIYLGLTCSKCDGTGRIVVRTPESRRYPLLALGLVMFGSAIVWLLIVSGALYAAKEWMFGGISGK